MRLLDGLARTHLLAWRALTRRRAVARGRGAEAAAPWRSSRRSAIFASWRRQLGVRRAVGALRLAWFESVVLACWGAWRAAALVRAWPTAAPVPSARRPHPISSTLAPARPRG